MLSPAVVPADITKWKLLCVCTRQRLLEKKKKNMYTNYLDNDKVDSTQASVLVCPLKTHPFAHEAVVEGQAYELEGSLLDEVGIEDSHLSRFPRHVVGH